jgi:hypothetical protein
MVCLRVCDTVVCAYRGLAGAGGSVLRKPAAQRRTRSRSNHCATWSGPRPSADVGDSMVALRWGLAAGTARGAATTIVLSSWRRCPPLVAIPHPLPWPHRACYCAMQRERLCKREGEGKGRCVSLCVVVMCRCGVCLWVLRGNGRAVGCIVFSFSPLLPLVFFPLCSSATTPNPRHPASAARPARGLPSPTEYESFQWATASPTGPRYSAPLGQPPFPQRAGPRAPPHTHAPATGCRPAPKNCKGDCDLLRMPCEFPSKL